MKTYTFEELFEYVEIDKLKTLKKLQIFEKTYSIGTIFGNNTDDADGINFHTMTRYDVVGEEKEDGTFTIEFFEKQKHKKIGEDNKTKVHRIAVQKL